jgi:hypothetical protein
MSRKEKQFVAHFELRIIKRIAKAGPTRSDLSITLRADK